MRYARPGGVQAADECVKASACLVARHVSSPQLSNHLYSITPATSTKWVREPLCSHNCRIFLYVNLGKCMMVVYNIANIYIIQNVLKLSPTNHALKIAASIVSQSGRRKEEYYEGRRENQEAGAAPAPA
jgi:hypothetical protein